MDAKKLELILSRQLADCLLMPIFITDPEGNLLFYNEPAEGLLGKRFDDTGPMPASEWATVFKPQDEEGNMLPPEALPLMQTLSFRRPAHGTFWIENLKGELLELAVTSFPLIGRADRYLGAVAIFWKLT